MKIAINALPIGISGGRDYAIMIVKYLTKIDKENQYFVFASPSEIKKFHKVSNLKIIKGVSSPSFLRFLWEQLWLPFKLKKLNCDVLYTLSSIDIFFSPCPTAMKIANMVPFYEKILKKEKRFRKLKLIGLKYLAKLSSKTVQTIITMSETAKKNLIKNGLDQEKIKAILHSADIENLQKKEFSSLPNKFIFAAGHIMRYKNYKELIEGYKILSKKRKEIPPLLIAGFPKDKKYFKEIKSLINNDLKSKVRFLGLVPRSSIGTLYKKCQFFIFPSTVETCPRTLIEALKLGTAILSPNVSVMPEICQDAALYFNPENPNDIAEKINHFLNNKGLIQKMKQKSKRRAKSFNWKKTTKKTLEILKETAKK